ncbi:MAG: hypothetical protein ACRYGI_11150 [Janthinobacterium lividum]
MSDAQRRFAAETIHFGFRPIVTGLTAIVVSRHGVAAVLIGTAQQELYWKLAEALLGADLVEDETSVGAILNAVARYSRRSDRRTRVRPRHAWKHRRAGRLGGSRHAARFSPCLSLHSMSRQKGRLAIDPSLARELTEPVAHDRLHGSP